MVEQLPTSGPLDDCHLELLARPGGDAARVWGNALQTGPRRAGRPIDSLSLYLPRAAHHILGLALSVRRHCWRPAFESSIERASCDTESGQSVPVDGVAWRRLPAFQKPSITGRGERHPASPLTPLDSRQFNGRVRLFATRLGRRDRVGCTGAVGRCQEPDVLLTSTSEAGSPSLA